MKQTMGRVHACGVTAETRGQSYHLSWGCAPWVTDLLCESLRDQERTQVFDLGGGVVRNKSYQVGEFANIRSADNEHG